MCDTKEWAQHFCVAHLARNVVAASCSTGYLCRRNGLAGGTAPFQRAAQALHASRATTSTPNAGQGALPMMGTTHGNALYRLHYRLRRLGHKRLRYRHHRLASRMAPLAKRKTAWQQMGAARCWEPAVSSEASTCDGANVAPRAPRAGCALARAHPHRRPYQSCRRVLHPWLHHQPTVQEARVPWCS